MPSYQSIYAQAGLYQIGMARTGFYGFSTSQVTKESILLQPLQIEDKTASGDIYNGQALEKGSSDDTVVKYSITTSAIMLGIASHDIALWNFHFEEDDPLQVIKTGEARVMVPWDISLRIGIHLEILHDGIFYPTSDGKKSNTSVAQLTDTITASDFGFKVSPAMVYP